MTVGAFDLILEMGVLSVMAMLCQLTSGFHHSPLWTGGISPKALL